MAKNSYNPRVTVPDPARTSKGYSKMGHEKAAKGKAANKHATMAGYPSKRNSKY